VGYRVPEDPVASHASALKAHRQNVVHREHNRQFRSKLRNALRAIRALVDEDDFLAAKGELKATVSLIDRMVAKGVIHKNAGARYKSRLQTKVAAGTAAKKA
jgi:small subunit ribosomal protein S20